MTLNAMSLIKLKNGLNFPGKNNFCAQVGLGFISSGEIVSGYITSSGHSTCGIFIYILEIFWVRHALPQRFAHSVLIKPW